MLMVLIKRRATKRRGNEVHIGSGRRRSKAGRVTATAQTHRRAAVVAALNQATQDLHPEQVTGVFHGVLNVGFDLSDASIAQIVPRPLQPAVESANRQHVASRFRPLAIRTAVLSMHLKTVGSSHTVLEGRVGLVGYQHRPQRITGDFGVERRQSAIHHRRDFGVGRAVRQPNLFQFCRVPTNRERQ